MEERKTKKEAPIIIPVEKKKDVLLALLALRSKLKGEEKKTEMVRLDKIAETVKTTDEIPPEIVLRALNEEHPGLGDSILQAIESALTIEVKKEDTEFFKDCASFDEIIAKLKTVEKVNGSNAKDIVRAVLDIQTLANSDAKIEDIFIAIDERVTRSAGLREKMHYVAVKELIKLRKGPHVLIPIFSEIERRLAQNPPEWLEQGEITQEINAEAEKRGVSVSETTKKAIKTFFYEYAEASQISERAQSLVFIPKIETATDIIDLRQLIDRMPHSKNFDLGAKTHALGTIDTILSGQQIKIENVRMLLPKTPIGVTITDKIILFALKSGLIPKKEASLQGLTEIEKIDLARLKESLAKADSLLELKERLQEAETSDPSLFSKENGLAQITRYMIVISALERRDVSVIENFKDDDFIMEKIKSFGDYDKEREVLSPKTEVKSKETKAKTAQPSFLQKLFGKN